MPLRSRSVVMRGDGEKETQVHRQIKRAVMQCKALADAGSSSSICKFVDGVVFSSSTRLRQAFILNQAARSERHCLVTARRSPQGLPIQRGALSVGSFKNPVQVWRAGGGERGHGVHFTKNKQRKK